MARVATAITARSDRRARPAVGEATIAVVAVAIVAERAAVLAIVEPNGVTGENPMTRIRHARPTLVGEMSGMRSKRQLRGRGRRNTGGRPRLTLTQSIRMVVRSLTASIRWMNTSGWWRKRKAGQWGLSDEKLSAEDVSAWCWTALVTPTACRR